MRGRVVLVILSAGGLLYHIANLTSAAAEIPTVAFFGFQLINTSIEPITPADKQRIRMLDDMVRQELAASGRFQLLSSRTLFSKRLPMAPVFPTVTVANGPWTPALSS